jgi:hypothetical protein
LVAVCSRALRGSGRFSPAVDFFNFDLPSPEPQLPEPAKPVETDGYLPYPTLPAWPAT